MDSSLRFLVSLSGSFLEDCRLFVKMHNATKRARRVSVQFANIREKDATGFAA